MMTRPFCPSGDPINHTVTASSVAVKLVDVPGNQQLRLHNRSTAEVAVKFGTSSVTATADGMTYPAGALEVLTLPPGCTHIAIIGTASSGKFQIQLGVGW